MIKSMTAFGRAQAVVDGRELTVELKSVNNRFFDCSAKLPRAFSFLEERVKPYLQTKGITRGKVDVFVATVGSGSTFSGSVKYLKEQNKFIKAVAVEPEDSPLISKGISGVHKIQGIGANFIPEILDLSLIDEVKTANYQKSLKFARFLAKTEGILVGISSGAALSVAIDLAKLDENTNKNIVVILPDSGSRYVSTELFD